MRIEKKREVEEQPLTFFWLFGWCTQTFKRLLLNRCQEEFEATNKAEEKNRQKNRAEMSREERLALEEEEFFEKKKMLGNITFIGELYKINMLNEKIMHFCIRKLLGDITNPALDDMEALCKLLTSIGSRIDHQQAKSYMDQYFARIGELLHNKSLPPRIIFMLQDLVELRRNNWVKPKPAPSSSSSTSTTATPSASQKYQNQPPVIAIRPQAALSQQQQQRASPSSSSQRSGQHNRAGSGEWEVVGGSARGGRQSSQQRPGQRPDDLIPATLGPAGGSLSSMGQGAKGWNQGPSTPKTELRATSVGRGAMMSPPVKAHNQANQDRLGQSQKPAPVCASYFFLVLQLSFFFLLLALACFPFLFCSFFFIFLH